MPVGQEVRGAAIGRTLTAADVLRGKKAMDHGPRVEGAVVLVAAAVSLAATAAAGLVEGVAVLAVECWKVAEGRAAKASLARADRPARSNT